MLEDTDLKAEEEQMKLINFSNSEPVMEGLYSFFCRTMSMQQVCSLYLAEQVQLPPGPLKAHIVCCMTKRDSMILKTKGC